MATSHAKLAQFGPNCATRLSDCELVFQLTNCKTVIFLDFLQFDPSAIVLPHSFNILDTTKR